MIWDGNNLFRRNAGNKGLANLKFNGRTTGAIHGTIKSIVTDIQTYKPDECAVVFDGNGAKSRKQRIYAGYKANRSSSMDDDLQQQLNITIDILRAAGICTLQKAGIDADDAIGALASIPKRSVLIMSADKDFLQLVSPTCSQIRIRGEGPELWTEQTVKDKMQVYPSQISDYLALCGDAVDGIPGLRGCGPKNAIQLLKDWDCLEKIIRHYYELPPKWKYAVEIQRDELRTFHRLTKLDTSVISATAMASIIPRLTPQKYSNDLSKHCEMNGLVWLQKWFLSHRPLVTASPRGLWG